MFCLFCNYYHHKQFDIVIVKVWVLFMKIHLNIMNNKHLLIALGLLLACNHATYAQKGKSKEAKTTFQTAEPWKPETDVRADATMVYGTLDKPGVTFEQRIQSWRDKGYLTEFMTGVAWGDYKDYFLGKWDGVDGHLKEGQRDRNADYQQGKQQYNCYD